MVSNLLACPLKRKKENERSALQAENGREPIFLLRTIFLNKRKGNKELPLIKKLGGTDFLLENNFFYPLKNNQKIRKKILFGQSKRPECYKNNRGKANQ